MTINTELFPPCAICLESLLPSDARALLGCGHTYHLLCIVSMMQRGGLYQIDNDEESEHNHKCPYCRASIMHWDPDGYLDYSSSDEEVLPPASPPPVMTRKERILLYYHVVKLFSMKARDGIGALFSFYKTWLAQPSTILSFLAAFGIGCLLGNVVLTRSEFTALVVLYMIHVGGFMKSLE